MTTEEKIEDVMNEFDWLKVNKIMMNLNWTWFPEEKVPTITRMKRDARRLLNDVASSEKEDTWIETGGFKAEKFKSENNEICFSLQFILESSKSMYA